MKAIFVLTTADSEELARSLASALVETRLAACVNLVPGIRSVYRWEGQLCDDGEWLLFIKTVEEKFEAVRTQIRRLHSYQLPEVIAIPIISGDADYLRWLEEQTD